MRIAEIYQSIQGEGLLTGVESVFVRASGCNLRCHFCDTPYASWFPEGDDVEVEEIVDRVTALGVSHVVLTGGEPMLFAELIPLTERLRAENLHLTIETAGTLFLPVACDLMSISPKFSNSTPSRERAPKWHDRHERTRYAPGVVRSLMAEYDYQLKFVLDTPEDAEELLEWLDQLPGFRQDRVLLMPQGTHPRQLDECSAWLQPFCEDRGFQFCPRRHIEWFGAVRGT